MISEESHASNPDANAHPNLENIHQAEQEQKLALTSDINNLRQEHDHLRQRVNTLTGILLGAGMLLIASLSWMAYQTQSQSKLIQQLETVSASTEVLNRLTDLEQQLKTLSEETPEDLLSQIQTNQTQIEEIAAQLRQVEANEENLQNLTEAVRELTGRQIVPVTPTQPSPVQPEPVAPEPSDTDAS